MRLLSLSLVATAFLLKPCSVLAQGILIPRDRTIPVPGSYQLTDLDVHATLRDQVATVQVSQIFQNTGSRTMEVQFVFPVPDGSALDSFTLMVDGKELPAKLLKQQEARRIYEDIVRRKRDPALLEYVGRDALQTSIFPLPPGAERKVLLRYTQICRRDGPLVEFAYPLSTAKHSAGAIKHLNVTVRINVMAPLRNVYSPTHAVDVQRPDDKTAVIKLQQNDAVAPGDLRIFYQESDLPVGATLLSYRPEASEPGYFLLLASPEIAAERGEAVAKTVVLVVDKSGSMSGEKIEQAKGALRFVLDRLREGDTFNIVAYDSAVESFKPELQRYDDASRQEALRFVDSLYAGGSTDIDRALSTAMRMIQDRKRPSYVLFLTDGLPTTGEQREPAIVENVRKTNDANARLFAFGVGYDVNARLLDRLVRANHGISQYVSPKEDIEAAVSRFYAKVGSPALTDLKIELSGAGVNRSYPKELPDLFHGGQLVWVGRYRDAGDTTIHIKGRVGDEEKQFEFAGHLAKNSENSTYAFVEKLWAVRRVGEILDELDLKGTNQELIDELVQLSTRHGILTPYTAFLADERTDLARVERNAAAAREQLSLLGRNVDGQMGFLQRDFKGQLQQADSLAALPSPARASEFGASRQIGAIAVQGGGGGGGGGQIGLMPRRGGGFTPAQLQAAQRRGTTVIEQFDGQVELVESVRQVGNKTFYRKGGAWIDSVLADKDEETLGKAMVVEQFSDEFFALLDEQNADDAKYFTFDEPVTIALGGKIVRIVPPK